MRRLARDETPFLLEMKPRVTTLAWQPAGGNVILLGAHGPNRLARDETPHPLTRSCFIIFMGLSCFLLRSFLLLSRGSLGEASQGFIIGFKKFPATFTVWAFSPFFPQDKVQPLLAWKTQCSNQCRGYMRQKMMKSDKYGRNG